VEPEDATRTWKPDRTLLRAVPQPANTSGFALAADEETVIGATNLSDPSLFRSEPPPPLQDADIGQAAHEFGWSAHEDTTVDFVGSLSDLGRDEAEPAMTASVSGEKTTLYKPQRSHVPSEEPTDELDATGAAREARVAGAEQPKVIIAPAVLAGAPDPARTEATKKRRARYGADTKLGLVLCLLGGVALALSAAWRHPRTAPVAHDAFTRVAAAVSSLHGK
jgi:hypothetical protein